MIYEKMILDAGHEADEWQQIALPQLKAQLTRFYPNSAEVLALMEASARANAPQPGGVITTPITFYRAQVTAPAPGAVTGAGGGNEGDERQ